MNNQALQMPLQNVHFLNLRVIETLVTKTLQHLVTLVRWVRDLVVFFRSSLKELTQMHSVKKHYELLEI